MESYGRCLLYSRLLHFSTEPLQGLWNRMSRLDEVVLTHDPLHNQRRPIPQGRPLSRVRVLLLQRAAARQPSIMVLP
jgi:hypothetical protein